MKVFRWSESANVESEIVSKCADLSDATLGRSCLVRSQDSGSIVVAVDGSSQDWSAVDWAAAEAATRGCGLRIVDVAQGRLRCR